MRQIEIGSAFVFGGDPTSETGVGDGMAFLGYTKNITINFGGELALATSSQTGNAALMTAGSSFVESVEIELIDWFKPTIARMLSGSTLVFGDGVSALGLGQGVCNNSKFTLALVPIRCAGAYPDELGWDEGVWWFPNALGYVSGAIVHDKPSGDDAAIALPITFVIDKALKDQAGTDIPENFQMGFLGSMAEQLGWSLPSLENLAGIIDGTLAIFDTPIYDLSNTLLFWVNSTRYPSTEPLDVELDLGQTLFGNSDNTYMDYPLDTQIQNMGGTPIFYANSNQIL